MLKLINYERDYEAIPPSVRFFIILVFFTSDFSYKINGKAYISPEANLYTGVINVVSCVGRVEIQIEIR